ncbi:hypothetical protein Pla110_38520 [Polystyrenella longa]|uniref:Uncharacterized protein n=1 Tax=Polystyrenella longa TaxID=2528007 RepID=A0A518CS81_9PLAN|nr:hypothetical protein [Polystyrenella longa]QDU82097.1 hypothetical protein Pla110_38520 [Polystyrenella longa]
MHFPSFLEYCPPDDAELDELANQFPEMGEHEIHDPNSKIDNRTAIRIFLRSRGVTGLLFDRLIEPYDLGFYKKCDGKSSPVNRLPVIQRKSGFKRDIVSVRHDLDYYRGKPSRRVADWFYVISQIAVGEAVPMSWVEWSAVRLFGYKAWKSHRLCQLENALYGKNDYIVSLPDMVIEELREMKLAS